MDAELNLESHIAIEAAPSHRLGLDDLRPRAAASQSDSIG